MAQYIKNDINFHGARSKTRVVENRSAKQDSHSKSESQEDGWGSITNTSSNNNSTWDDGTWSDAPHDPPVQEDAWGQDRLVSGKSERNRKFRTYKENSTFRVPIQSLPNWDEVDNEFPVLGSRGASVPNVWEKRKQAFEEKAAIVPTSVTEEDMMMQRALELSKMEIRQEEERRRQLEEEYRLQTQLLEANPDMFDEFRLGIEEFAATAGGLAVQSSESFNDYPEKCPSDEFVDTEDDWQYSTTKTNKQREAKKGKKKTEYPSEEEGFSQLKQSSGLPSFNGNTTTKPKVPKVVEMFGGWGHTKKPFTQDITEDPLVKSNKWETVDTNFVTRPSKTIEIEDKPVCQPSSSVTLDVKLENTTNWDAIEAIDLKSETNELEKRNYLGTRDTVELNLKDCEPGYSLDQKEREFAIQSKKKISKPKVDMHTEVKRNTSISKEDGNKTDAGFERERNQNLNESCDEIASQRGKHGNQLSNCEQFQCISAEKNVVAKIDKKNASAKTKERNVGAKIDKKNASEETEERNVGAKIEVSSLQNKCSDSKISIENDYEFLLSHIDPNYTGAQLQESNQRYTIPVEEKSDILSMNEQPECFQATNQTYDYFLSDHTTQEGPTIPEPKPIKNETYSSSNPQLDSSNSGQCNTNDINPLYSSEPDSYLPLKMSHTNLNEPSLSTFGGYPTNVEDHHSPMDNNNMSHIEPPKMSVPTPEFTNPAFLPQPRPMMTPIMNPALMMGMNPMLMQQMMMLSNPFFVQQLQQMDMYYKSLGMPLTTGMPMFPQPMAMPIPPTLHNPNLQMFSNPMSSPTEENEMSPGSQYPEPESSHLDKVPPKVDQSDTDSFWFQDYMSTEASPSFIPPPKPTPIDAPTNTNVLPDATAFASLSLNPQDKDNDGILDNENASDPPSHRRSVVPGWEGGWGDIDVGSTSDTTSGWNDDNANGWSDNGAIAKSMRNSSRYVPENKAACRQPASRPYLGRPKT